MWNMTTVDIYLTCLSGNSLS